MNPTRQRMARLGCASALAAVLLAGCDQAPDAETPGAETPSAETSGSETTETAGASDTSAVAAVDPAARGEAGEAGELGGVGEAGETGESGEGGVDVARAATDPAEYRKALAVTEAHVLAARDALALGEREAAAEMFGHPVSEVLFDLEAVFINQGVQPFEEELIAAANAIYAGETSVEIAARSDAIIAILDEAWAKAPASSRTEADVAAEVIADQIERAAQQYLAAVESGRYEPYLDGYGFFKTADRLNGLNGAAVTGENAEAAAAIAEALALMGAAYPSAVPPEALDADRGALLAAASRVTLSL